MEKATDGNWARNTFTCCIVFPEQPLGIPTKSDMIYFDENTDHPVYLVK